MEIGIAGVGLVAPNIPDWKTGQAVLVAGDHYDLTTPLAKISPDILPANERRRTTALIKLAMQASQEAMQQSGAQKEATATVFSSSCGDLEIVDKIMEALCLSDKPVSPTLFHNSVHNAPAGYWSIGCHSHAFSSSISAHDGSFAAGLLEAATLMQSERRPVLLCAYDALPPATLFPFRPMSATFAIAMLLTPDAASWSLKLLLETGRKHTLLENTELETLRQGNPAARSLPLLRAMAANQDTTVVLPYLQGLDLEVAVASC